MKEFLSITALCVAFIICAGVAGCHNRKIAMEEGRKAYRDGFSDAAIPYEDTANRKWWLEGYMKEKRGE